MLKGFSLHELHRIEIAASGSPQMEDRGNIRVAHAGRRTCLAQETKLGRFVTQITFANDLQGHWTPEIDIERLVGHSHSPTTQLNRSAIGIQHHLIVLESPSLRCTFRIPGAAC